MRDRKQKQQEAIPALKQIAVAVHYALAEQRAGAGVRRFNCFWSPQQGLHLVPRSK